MKWISTHAFEILKYLVIAALTIAGAWGTLQLRLAAVDQKMALQDASINSVRGTVTRIEKEYIAQNAELKQQLREIQTQLQDIGKAVAVLADRAGYRGGRNNEE